MDGFISEVQRGIVVPRVTAFLATGIRADGARMTGKYGMLSAVYTSPRPSVYGDNSVPQAEWAHVVPVMFKEQGQAIRAVERHVSPLGRSTG